MTSKLRGKIKTVVVTTTAALLMITGVAPLGVVNQTIPTAYAESSIGGASSGLGGGGSAVGGVGGGGGSAVGGVGGVGGANSGSNAVADPSNKSNGWEDWKQITGDWANRIYGSKSKGGGLKFGDRVEDGKKGIGTVADWGCYLLSMAIQVSRSGSQTDFDPWDFIEHMHKNGYMSKSDDFDVGDATGGVESFTNGKMRSPKGGQHIINYGGTTDKSRVIKDLQATMDAGYYPILQFAYGNGSHFVAVDQVKDGVIYVFDPGSTKSNTVGGPTDTYGNNGTVTYKSIRVFEADTPIQKATGIHTTSGAAQGDSLTGEEQEKLDLAKFKWDEGMIPGMPTPREFIDEESAITYAIPDEWLVEDLDSLSKWKEEVKTEKRGSLTKIFRVGVMMVAILIILFSLLIASVFAFDKVNIFDFSLMRIITKDRMMVSPDGESTFFRGDNSTTKLINLRDMIIVQCLLLGVALFLLSGYGYKVLVLLKDFLLNRR